ncbi:MAG: ATP-binding domain-containing protein, partial [Planctomycetes bacterium]|nr:ATP-binding domain-containing protein [Planctomycetota bacterium]
KSRLNFLTEMTLDPPSSTQDLPDNPWKDEDYLILSTIHSAKGLEWDTVYIIHAADGNIPSDMATGDEEQIEEERRLFYVAMTRAKNRLYICHPVRYYFSGRYHGDEHSFSNRTRFLPDQILGFFEHVQAWEERGEESGEDDGWQTDLRTSDIRRRIKGFWR